MDLLGEIRVIETCDFSLSIERRKGDLTFCCVMKTDDALQLVQLEKPEATWSERGGKVYKDNSGHQVPDSHCDTDLV